MDLVAIAEANLPLARLYEGHVNALRLIQTLGDAAACAQVRHDCDAGLLFGVWGADGATPLGVKAGLWSEASGLHPGSGQLAAL